MNDRAFYLALNSFILSFLVAPVLQAGYAIPATTGGLGVYNVELLSNCSNDISLLAGDSFPIDIALSRQNVNKIVIYATADINVSGGRLEYNAYQWNTDYSITGDSLDLSTRTTNPPSFVESLHFENNTIVPETPFPEGLLLSFQLEIPLEMQAGTTIEISYKHDMLLQAGLLPSHDAVIGGPLIVSIAPEPTILILMVVAGLTASRVRYVH